MARKIIKKNYSPLSLTDLLFGFDQLYLCLNKTLVVSLRLLV